MNGNTVIFVTDTRQRYIADYLPGKVHRLDWKQKYDEEKVRELIASCDQIILPTPVSKMDKHKRLKEIVREELADEKPVKPIVFGGAFTKEWQEFLEDKAVPVYDLMRDEKVAVKNARITAEATVAELLKYSDYSILEQKIIVTGYGRCGREVANLLKVLGA